MTDDETYTLDLDVTFGQYLQLMESLLAAHEAMHIAASAGHDPGDSLDDLHGLMEEVADSIGDDLLDRIEAAEEEHGLNNDDDGFVEIEFD